MRLKEWMDFNRPFMACDFRVKILEKPRWDTNAVSWDICRRLFGDYEIARLSIDKYPKTDSACFKLLLWGSSDAENE